MKSPLFLVRRRVAVYGAGFGALLSMLGGCKPGDILDVPPPSNVVASTSVQDSTTADEVFDNGRYYVYQGRDAHMGLTEITGLMSDEFTTTHGSVCCSNSIDARLNDAGTAYTEPGNYPLEQLIYGRSELLLSVVPLRKYVNGSSLSKVGEAFALAGYSELLVAEDYCAGATLSQTTFGGGIVYSPAYSTDSLLKLAITHFDSALANANGNDTIQWLARVGMGRAFVDLGQFSDADTSVTAVPTNFAYSTQLQGFVGQPYTAENLYASATTTAFYTAQPCQDFNVSDHEGTNGLNFASSGDPRLGLNAGLVETCDAVTLSLPDSVAYYPARFGNPSTQVPLATGIEARLVHAEALLQANQVGPWAAALRSLRGDSTDTHVTFPAADSLPSDSAETAVADSQVSTMFRERAFWLFGMGERLGDLRRLVRQYNRGTETVYPTGAYNPAMQGNASWRTTLPTPITTYGADVSLTLPTPASNTTSGNPNYKGCTTNVRTA